MDDAESLAPTSTGQAGPGCPSAGGFTSLTVKAPAKINLTLAVLGKRPDGYHEIESVVLPVTLYDELSLGKFPEEEIRLSCDDPSLPDGSDNLVWRAAERIRRHRGIRRGVEIRLTKRIPAGAGLGGGSSDAASTLLGLNALWQLRLTTSELVGLAAEIGSDVPLFLNPGPSIIRGRGERVDPVEFSWPGRIVLVVPRFGMSTADVYRRWRPSGVAPPSADEVIEAYRAGQELDELLFNMLEEPAFAIEPRLIELRLKLVELGAPRVRMSGSGAAMFALFGQPGQADDFADDVARHIEADVHVLRASGCEQL